MSNAISGVVNAQMFGAKGDNSTDDRAALQAAINATPAGGMLFIPKGTYLVSTALEVKKDITIQGEGGAFQTSLKPSANVSVMTKDSTVGSTTRAFIKGITFLGRNATDTSPLLDLQNWFICSFEDCYFWKGYRAVRVYGATSAGDSTSALNFRGCIFQYFDGYAVSVEGQYSVHFDQCDFERAYNTTSVGSAVNIDNVTYGRSFNNSSFQGCHFELATITLNAEGVSVTGCHIYNTTVKLGEYSSNCRVVSNSVVTSPVLDLGFHNFIDGTFTNSREQGITRYEVRGNVVKDTYYRGVTGDEYLFFTNVWPLSATITAATITYQDTAATTLYQPQSFTLAIDSGDTNVTTHIPKRVFSNMWCGRVGADGGLTAVSSAGTIETRVKRNMLANGTFNGNLATSWSSGGGGTMAIAASGTAGYSTLTITGAAGYYQAMPTVAGRRYMLVAQTLQNTGFVLTVGSVWSGGSVVAPASSYLMGNGAYLMQTVFEATVNGEVVSIGNLTNGSVDVKWIALVDLDDMGIYGVQAPAAGRWNKGDVVWNINSGSGSASGWICTAAGNPGTWLALGYAGVTPISGGGTGATSFAAASIPTLSGSNTWTGITNTWTQPAQSSGSPNMLVFTGGAHTTLTSGTEATDININLARTVQFATTTPATQRAVRLQAPTYSCNTAAQTITTASTLEIGGAPVAGTNVTITNPMALRIAGGGFFTGGGICINGAYGGTVTGMLLDYNQYAASTSRIMSFNGSRQNMVIDGLTTALLNNGTQKLITSTTGVDVAGNVVVTSAGSGLKVKEGSNATMGTATLTAGAVTVSTTAVTASSRIQLTGNSDGGTPGWLRVSARSAGTSFTITSSSGTDTSTVAWIIVEPSP